MKKESTINLRNIVSKKKLIELKKLKPIEKVFPTHLQYIKEQIEEENQINIPLIIDKTDKIILDGSHRYAYLKQYGYKYAPVIEVDYSSSLISIGSDLIHRFINSNNLIITKNDIIINALNNKLLDPRTTRHFFPFRKENIPTKLEDLQSGNEQDITYLISRTNIKKEILNNQNYIKEIENELQFINRYIKEQESVKNYLEKQIVNMQDITDII